MCLYYFLELFLEGKLLEIELKRLWMLKDFVTTLQTAQAVQPGFCWEGPSRLCSLTAVPSHGCAWIACGRAPPADPTRLGLPVS